MRHLIIFNSIEEVDHQLINNMVGDLSGGANPPDLGLELEIAMASTPKAYVSTHPPQTQPCRC